MQKTKNEWADYTWNPISGCLHDCPYCYAEKIANRFGTIDKNEWDYEDAIEEIRTEDYGTIVEINERLEKEPCPYNFIPTFHRYHLNKPQKIKTPQNIFVGSMGDTFGRWMPDEWIQEVFKACEAAPWHRWLFLTKNSKRYDCLRHLLADGKKYDNWWFGVTATNQTSFDEQAGNLDFHATGYNTFVSLEPLQGRIELDGLGNTGINWVIVGAMTGPKAKQHQPKREWVADIVTACKEANVPVFLKNNLKSIWESCPGCGHGGKCYGECRTLIQEWPWEVK